MTPAPGTPGGAAAAASPGGIPAPPGAATPPGDRRAPHRRPTAAGRGARLFDRAVVVAYEAGSWTLGRLPLGPTARVGGLVADGVYRLWPEKRRHVRANAVRVLGTDPDDPRADDLARAVFRNQVRWVVEGMHLLRMSPAEQVAQFHGPTERLRAIWQESKGVILVGLHFGNGEAAIAALAQVGLPVHALAEDTTYEELFERLTARRREWGLETIRWRNLREVYRVLRAGRILGLLVDWGYRPDDQPVRFLGSWTTLPAGPAVLAARTGATIVPFWTIRRPDGAFVGGIGAPILVTSTEPAEIARATQAIADALEPVVRKAPEQWCVFQPIWPEDRADEAALAARARDLTGAGIPSAGIRGAAS